MAAMLALLQICTATLEVVGGSLLNANGNTFVPPPAGDPGLPVGTWECPPGTYYHADEICPIW